MVPSVQFDLAAVQDLCLRERIVELSVFGSVLRSDFGPESDVDVMVDFERGVAMDVDDYERLESGLEKLFGRRVDVVNKRFLKNPFVRHEILQTRRILYAA